MAKQSVPVPFSSIRSKYSTINVHPLNETSSRFLKETGHPPSPVPGRYAHHRIDPTGDPSIHSDGHESPGISGFYNKQREVVTIPNSDNHISWLYDQFDNNALHSALQKNPNDLYIIAYHVPGKTNVVADRESREFWDNSDWMLDPPTDDLHQLEARPPVSSFGCIQRELETPSGLHIPPIQFNCASSQQGRFGQDRNCPSGPTSDKPDRSSTDSPVDPTTSSGRVSYLQQRYSNDIATAFRETLPNYSSQQLDVPHKKHTNPDGNAGAAGVFQDKLILFQHP